MTDLRESVTAMRDEVARADRRLRRINRVALMVMAMRRLGTVIASTDLEREALAGYLADAVGEE